MNVLITDDSFVQDDSAGVTYQPKRRLLTQNDSKDGPNEKESDYFVPESKSDNSKVKRSNPKGTMVFTL